MRKDLKKRILAFGVSIMMVGTLFPVGGNGPLRIQAGYTGIYTEEVNGVNWEYSIWETSNGIKTATCVKPLEKNNLKVKNIIIPETLGGAAVTGIGMSAFSGTDIEAVSFPDTVSALEYEAFADCKSLKIVNLPDNYVSFNGGVFKGCEGITEIKCYSIYGSSSFEGCTNLKKVVIKRYPSSNVVTIGNNAFKDCTSLETLEIEGLDGNSNIIIEKNAFEATALKYLEFPCDVEIEEGAFQYCMNLTDVKFEKKSTLGSNAFQSSFAKEAKEKKVEFLGETVIGEGAFKGCSGLNKVEFQERASVRTTAFEKCIGIEHLIFNKETRIDYASFANCDSLEEVIFKDNVELYCPSWPSVQAPFYECSKLKRIEFYGEKMEGPIKHLESLEEIVFHQNVTNIQGYLAGLPKLKNIVFWAYNPIININNVLDKESNYNIIGYRYADEYHKEGMDTVYKWAQSIDKTESFRNIISSLQVKYDGVQIEGRIPDSEKITVNAFYYNDTLNPVKIEKAKDTNDLTGYQLKIGDSVKLGDNYFTVSFGSMLQNGSYTGMKRAITSLNLGMSMESMVEGTKLTKDMIEVEAVYNDGTKENVSPSAIIMEERMIEVGENEIKVTYQGVEGKKTILGTKKEISKTTAVYDGYIYEGDPLEEKNIRITNYYNNNTEEIISNYIIKDLSNLILTEEDCKNAKFDAESNKKYVIKNIEVVCGETHVTMQVKIVPKEVEKVIIAYDNKEVVEGCKIDPASIRMLVYYNNSEVGVPIDVTEEMFNIYSIQVGQNSGITVSYKGIESNGIIVTGVSKKITDVMVSYNSKLENKITQGTKLEASSVEITELYNDGTKNIRNGTEENTKFEDYSIKLGTNQIAVVYTVKQKDGTLSTFRKIMELEGIKATLTEIKAVYNGTVELGSEIVIGKVILLGTYSNGIKDAEFQGIFTTEGKILQVGKNKIVVYYYDEESGTNFNCIMEVEGILPVQTNTPLPSESVSPIPTSSQTPTENPGQDPTQTPKASKAPNNSGKVEGPKVSGSPKTVFKINSTLKKLKLDTRKKIAYTVRTNKKVIIKINAKNAKSIKYQLVSKGKKVNKKAWKQIKKNKLILNQTIKNSVLYFQYKKQDGMVTTVKTNGFMLDKTAPVVAGIKNNKSYKRALKVRFKDNISGIKVAKLNGKVIKNGYQIKKKGSYVLKVTDRAGNIRTIKFKIK